jgi:hypothetical protein
MQHLTTQHTVRVAQRTIVSPRHSSWTFDPWVLGCFAHISITASVASAAAALKKYGLLPHACVTVLSVSREVPTGVLIKH